MSARAAQLWRLTLTTTGSAYTARVRHLAEHLSGRLAVRDLVITSVYRTVTVTGPVAELLYLLKGDHGFRVHAEAGRLACIALEPLTDDEENGS